MEHQQKKLVKRHHTLYQRLAQKYNTIESYVGEINNGRRTPTRGKGFLILQELKKIKENDGTE
jgi:hypothetical protein